jgi:hypothetical protein
MIGMPRRPPSAASPGTLDLFADLPALTDVRAALKAGVKPGHVAKHFGLPLAAVRKIAADAE